MLEGKEDREILAHQDIATFSGIHLFQGIGPLAKILLGRAPLEKFKEPPFEKTSKRFRAKSRLVSPRLGTPSFNP